MLSHPALPFLLAAVVVPFLPRIAGAVALLVAPVASFALLHAIDRDAGETVGFFTYELTPVRLDDLSAPFAYIFVLAALLAGVFGAQTMSKRERVTALLYAGAGLGVVLAGDLLTLFVFWEVKALASAALIAFGGRAASNATAMRYLLVHVAGGSALLGGVVWHLSDGGGLTFSEFGTHGSTWLILTAFLVSAAVPPLHPWLPDAYPEASVAGTVFLSAFTTKAAVYVLARGFPGTELLVVLGVGMALYGVVYAVLENDIRRLLGYHIVSQVGYMVAAVGIGTASAINGATAHAFAHILYKGLLLMGAGAVIYATGRSKLTELGGLARAMPAVLILYLIGAMSISGFPLFSGFVSKELVVDAARGDGRDLVVQLLKLASVGTFLHTGLKLPWFAWGGRARTDLQLRPVPVTMVIAMALAAAANVAIGVRPELIYDLMPFPVTYEPYSVYKLVEITQLLTFTALAFWLLAKKLGGEPTVTLDTDWLYRSTPPRIAAGVASLSAVRSGAIAATRSRLARAMTTSADGTVRPGARAVGLAGAGLVPTVVLGMIALGTMLIVLIVGLGS